MNHKEQKHQAAVDSQLDAYSFVHGHEDLILGASAEEIERAVKKVAKALRDLRVAQIDAYFATSRQQK